MSIERMKRLWAVTEPGKLRALLDFLAGLEAVHLVEAVEPSPPPSPPRGEGEDPSPPPSPSRGEGEEPSPPPSPSRGEGEEPEGAQPAFSRAAVSSVEIDARIARLAHVLEIMNVFQPPKRAFGENFVGFPLEVTAEAMSTAVATLDVDELDAHVTALADDAASLEHRMEEIHLELGRLTTWAHIDCCAPAIFRRCVGWLGTVTARMKRMLDESERAREVLVVNELGRGKDNRVLLQIVALREHRDEAGDLCRLFDFTPLPLPPGVSVRDMIKALQSELTGYEERVDAIEATMKHLAERRRAEVITVLGFHEMRRDVLRSQDKTLASKRLAVVTGYARARDVGKIAKAVGETFPETGLRFDDPAIDENVPVELRTNKLVEPAQFLVSMFGMPSYRAFDPSPFIMLNFLLFFGFCFGDVIYGLGLIALGLYIARRVKGYPGIHNFFLLLAWGGVSATIVGALTGSWAADLPGYFGKGNWLQKLRDSMCLLDMMEKPVAALVVSLGIGVLNQFYGIAMKMYTEFRRHDVPAALFDGGLWLLVLPGLILLVMPVFLPGAPGWLTTVGATTAVLGAVGLVLTQGRHEKSFLGKALVGFVSIYGILGSYGSTAFIGDTLSYCRLLALGLTTSIVGMCFNIIAELGKNMAANLPVVGLVVFILVLLVGHVFNFLISILGAFVHSARLIFLEFFGRFYEIGGVRFSPLGTSERVRVVDKG